MRIIQKNIRTFLEDEEGVTAIEYALLASVIAMGALGGFSALGGAVAAMWNTNMALIGAALGG